jgi:hypothetical protein
MFLLVCSTPFCSAAAQVSGTSPRTSAGPQQPTTRVVDVRVRGGATVRYLFIVPMGAPPQTAVMLFAGGNGLLNIRLNGTIGTNLAQNSSSAHASFSLGRGSPSRWWMRRAVQRSTATGGFPRHMRGPWRT